MTGGTEDEGPQPEPAWMAAARAEVDRQRQELADQFWMEAESSDIEREAQYEAESMVAYLLAAEERGDGWDPYHLLLPDGRRIEVAVEVALLNRRSPRFVVRPHRSRPRVLENGASRPAADGHVLALEISQRPREFSSLPSPPDDPLWSSGSPWDSWRFWVLPAVTVATHPKRKIRVAEVEELGGPPVSWDQLAGRVDAVVPPRGMGPVS